MIDENEPISVSKERILDLVILLSVSYFCLGNEIRYGNKKGKGLEKRAKMYHSKAVQTACLFLP